MARLDEIIKNDSQISTGIDLNIMRPEVVSSELVRLTGHGRQYLHVFEAAFDHMTPERAFALYVLASALSDIEQVEPQYESGGTAESLNKQRELFKVARERRICRLQETEETHRREYAELVQNHKVELREFNKQRKGRLGTTSQSVTKRGRKRIRHLHKKRMDSFNARRENEDPSNASLNWFLEERGMVEFWCHMADVPLLRCYQAVERRLLLLGRCSIKLHAVIQELREKQRGKGATRLNLLAKYEDRAFQS